jgi:hypothetical protein
MTISTWRAEYDNRIRKAAETAHARMMSGHIGERAVYLYNTEAIPGERWGSITTMYQGERDLHAANGDNMDAWKLSAPERISRAFTVDQLEKWILSLHLPIIGD